MSAFEDCIRQGGLVVFPSDTVYGLACDPEDRFAVERLGQGLMKVLYVTIRAGYHDKVDIPEQLALARKCGLLEKALDLEHASYFVSRMTIRVCDAPGLRRWRKLLFVMMARNATSPIDHFALPSERTVIMGSQVAI